MIDERDKAGKPERSPQTLRPGAHVKTPADEAKPKRGASKRSPAMKAMKKMRKMGAQ